MDKGISLRVFQGTDTFKFFAFWLGLYFSRICSFITCESVFILFFWYANLGSFPANSISKTWFSQHILPHCPFFAAPYAASQRWFILPHFHTFFAIIRSGCGLSLAARFSQRAIRIRRDSTNADIYAPIFIPFGSMLFRLPYPPIQLCQIAFRSVFYRIAHFSQPTYAASQRWSFSQHPHTFFAIIRSGWDSYR